MQTLATALADWTDIDIAAHALALSLGLMPRQAKLADAKWVYWSNHPLGTELVVLLDRLTDLGFLERRDEPDFQYRVRAAHRADLEIEAIWRRALTVESSPELTLVVLRCLDLERSRTFYEGLGLSFVAEQHGSGPRHYSTQLGETVLELYPSANASSASLRFGIRVAVVEAAVAAVDALGGSVEQFDRAHSPRWALVRDPDGTKIELTARGK